jgi:hypothetical protein
MPDSKINIELNVIILKKYTRLNMMNKTNNMRNMMDIENDKNDKNAE